MLTIFRRAGRTAGLWLALCATGTAAIPAVAAAAEYISADITDVKPEDKAQIAHPQPVQVLFQFSTKGAPNARATKFLKAQVFQAIKDSGDFADIGDTPTPNGAVLSVSIDNVADTGDAEAKGFVTGATFFLVGSTVKDNYTCTVSYAAGPSAPTITKTAHHALYTQVGMTAPAPKDAVKVGAMKEALNIMVRQIVSNPLNEVARDPAFLGAPAQSAPPASAPTAAPANTATAAASSPAPSSESAGPATNSAASTQITEQTKP